jgi:1-acyl-sn-glycerol-3-phosphate acyltransferase
MTVSSRPAVQRARAFFRWLAPILEALFTRTTISGVESIPITRPLIFAANHASTYDAVMLVAHMPADTELVGPGDFKLLFPADVLIGLAGIVRIKRAALDRDSLRLMGDALKAGKCLALFPEGGTWEKRLDDVKPGVAYLSQTHDATIVPVSFGGTYRVWGKILRLQRPHVTIHFGAPIPPVQIVDRKQRAEELRAASLRLMHAIYAHLPPADQARYDEAARQIFSGRIVGASEPATPYAVLAELASKPNLISPLLHNARLPLQPIAQISRSHSAADFMAALNALRTALNGEFSGYLNYRLGDHKAAQALSEIEQMAAQVSAVAPTTPLRFAVQITLADAPLPPNV